MKSIKLRKEFDKYYIVVAEYEKYNEIQCYDFTNQLLWTQKDKSPNSCNIIVDFIKINNWIKVFYADNKVIKIRTEAIESSPCGVYIDYGTENFDSRLLQISIDGKSLIYNNNKITFDNTIDDIKLFKENILILANSKAQSCPHNWLTLYSYNILNGKCNWVIKDYTEKTGRKASRIDYFGFDGNQLYAETFDAFRLNIDAESGEVIECLSFTKYK